MEGLLEAKALIDGNRGWIGTQRLVESFGLGVLNALAEEGYQVTVDYTKLPPLPDSTPWCVLIDEWREGSTVRMRIVQEFHYVSDCRVSPREQAIFSQSAHHKKACSPWEDRYMGLESGYALGETEFCTLLVGSDRCMRTYAMPLDHAQRTLSEFERNGWNQPGELGDPTE